MRPALRHFRENFDLAELAFTTVRGVVAFGIDAHPGAFGKMSGVILSNGRSGWD